MLIAAAALALGTASSSPAADARSQCSFPHLPRAGRLVVLRMSGGAAVSTVAVAGLSEGTTTGEIRIGPGRGKLQLAIVSSEPIVARFTGAVSRLSDVVMVNSAGAGVTGLPASKVHFSVGRRCDLPVDSTKVLGKSPNLSEDISDLHKAWTDGRHFRHREIHGDFGSGKNKLAEKMDWMYPGGVVAIEPARVVSSGSALKYSVLPDTAGAFQLEQSGALVEVGRAELDAWTAKAKVIHGERLINLLKIGNYGPVLRVTRPIQMPPGLCGAHLLTFIVPSKDYLAGDPCHSEVLAEDGHILAPASHAEDPDCGLALFDEQVRPHSPGPLQVRVIYCSNGSPKWVAGQSYVNAVSPDARHVAYFPNSYQRLPLRVEQISDNPPLMRDYPVSSTGYFTLEWLGRPGYQWSDDSIGLWVAKPLFATDTSGPIRPAFVSLDGAIRLLPELRHPAGPAEALLWVGGQGRAIARFRGEPFDSVTKKLRPPAYGMVDAANGTVLDDFDAADFELLRKSNTGLKEFFYADRVLPAQREDGRLQALMDFGRWVLWAQGEAPRVVPDLPLASGAAIAADGKTVLMLRPNLPGQDNRLNRIFCEAWDEDDRPCYEYKPAVGTWASLHEVATGRLLWKLPWTFDRHEGDTVFALSPDGRFALITLPSRTDRYKSLIALVSMSDGKILQTLAPRGGVFGFAAGGKIAWIMTGNATILYDVH